MRKCGTVKTPETKRFQCCLVAPFHLVSFENEAPFYNFELWSSKKAKEKRTPASSSGVSLFLKKVAGVKGERPGGLIAASFRPAKKRTSDTLTIHYLFPHSLFAFFFCFFGFPIFSLIVCHGCRNSCEPVRPRKRQILWLLVNDGD